MAGNKIVAPYIKVFSSLYEDNQGFLAAVEQIVALRDFFWSNTQMKDFLCSPAVSSKWREATIRKILPEVGADDAVVRIIILLLHKGRILEFSNFAGSLQEFADERCGILRGVVESAVALTDVEAGRLKTMIDTNSGKSSILDFRVREELLGGLRVRMSHMVLDSTLDKKLNEAKIKLTQKRA